MPHRLEEILPLLRDSYNGIDIRAVLAKSQKENRWYYIFLKVRLTKAPKVEIQESHEKKMNEVWAIDYDDFKVVLESKDIQELNAFLNEIQTGHIILKAMDVWAIGTKSQNIFENLLSQKNGMYSTEDERNGFNDLTILISKTENPEMLLHHLGISTESHNLRFHEVTSLLDTELNALSHSNYIVIIFPMYCKPTGSPGNFLAKYSIHRSLRPHCTAILSSNDGHVIKRVDLKDPSLVQNGPGNNDDYDSVVIPLTVRTLPGTFVQIDIRHTNLGEICSDKTTVPKIFDSKIVKTKQSLASLFTLSRANQKIWEYLLFNDDDTQMSATTWLLTLLGFSSINLGAIDSGDENMMQGTKPLHAIDIISYDPSNEYFLAIDCTITPPASNKIDKIRNAARYVGSKLAGRVIPIIFCNKDCIASYDDAKDAGVLIIDSSNIFKLSELVTTGKLEEARTLFLGLLEPNDEPID